MSKGELSRTDFMNGNTDSASNCVHRIAGEKEAKRTEEKEYRRKRNRKKVYNQSHHLGIVKNV